MSSYKKNAASNRDALFGGASTNAPKTRATTTATSRSTTATTTTTTTNSTSKGYTSNTTNTATLSSRKSSVPLLTGAARTAKLAEAQDYRNKANECMKSGFFKRPDPVAACTYFKRAADAYQQLQDWRLERLFRVESGNCNMTCQAFASAASDYTRAAELILNLEVASELSSSSSSNDDVEPDGTKKHPLSLDERRRQASAYHKQAAAAWTQMHETAKAAASIVAAALAFHSNDTTSSSSSSSSSSSLQYLSKEALTGVEEAVEAHVPDPLNPYARFRQTGVSAYIDPNSDETAEHCSAATKELAAAHLVSRPYAHEPVGQLVSLLASVREFHSALYAAGAVSTILKSGDAGTATLSLSRSYVVETILALALGDAVLAEAQFLNRHVQDTFYLSTRECQLAEELFRAVKVRDVDALDAARSAAGPNRAALANLPPAVRDTVLQLRVSGMAKTTSSSTADPSSTEAASLPSLQELLQQKTGYETEHDAAAPALDSDALAAELDNLDILNDDDDENEDEVGDDELDAMEDDDIDLR
jgi:hypothetical protein